MHSSSVAFSFLRKHLSHSRFMGRRCKHPPDLWASLDTVVHAEFAELEPLLERFELARLVAFPKMLRESMTRHFNASIDHEPAPVGRQAAVSTSSSAPPVAGTSGAGAMLLRLRRVRELLLVVAQGSRLRPDRVCSRRPLLLQLRRWCRRAGQGPAKFVVEGGQEDKCRAGIAKPLQLPPSAAKQLGKANSRPACGRAYEHDSDCQGQGVVKPTEVITNACRQPMWTPAGAAGLRRSWSPTPSFTPKQMQCSTASWFSWLAKTRSVCCGQRRNASAASGPQIQIMDFDAMDDITSMMGRLCHPVADDPPPGLPQQGQLSGASS